MSIQPFFSQVNVELPIAIRTSLPSPVNLTNVSWSIVGVSGPVATDISMSQSGTTFDVPAGALLPGATYTIVIKCAYLSGRQGYASTTVSTGMGPSGGSCSVTPSSGDASTLFYIACASITDISANLPLTYQYYLVFNCQACIAYLYLCSG